MLKEYKIKEGLKAALAAGVFFLSLPAIAHAEQDFYGIQIKDEAWARRLVLNQGEGGDPKDLQAGPILSQEIHAEGSLKEIDDRLLDFRVTVFNDSSTPIPTDFRLRDFVIHMRDGKKYPLVDNEDSAPTWIEPKTKLTFLPATGNLRLRNNEVEMIVASFDLGRTRIFLFPWSKKDTVSKLVSPAVPVVPIPPSVEPVPPPVAKVEKPQAQPKPKVPKKETPKGARKKTPSRNFWDWFKLRKEKKDRMSRTPVQPTAVERSPGPAASTTPASSAAPGSQQKLETAIDNFKYVPSSSSAGASAASMPASGRAEAHVISFNKDYNFVTVNIGLRDGVQKNMTIAIMREGRLVAKAKVKQLREAVAAAAILPNTVRSEARTGDQVSFV